MPAVEQWIDIAAPLPVVYDFVTSYPERMAEWWPPIELQERVTPPPTALGSISRYVYDMMGVKIKGEHQIIELVENHRLLVKTISGIDSVFDFHFMPIDGGTRLSIRVQYRLPGSVLGQLMNRAAIEQKNLRDLQQGLENLKRLVEAAASSVV
jgi:uncharacterized membrane protein